MRISIPKEKLQKVQQNARWSLDQTVVSMREIAKFWGKTTATMRTIPLAPLHYKSLPNAKELCSTTKLHSWRDIEQVQNSCIIRPSQQGRFGMVGCTQKNLHGSTNVCPPEPTTTVLSDTSNKWWEAVLDGQSQTGGLWFPEEATYSINYLELLKACLVIKAFRKNSQNITVLI